MFRLAGVYMWNQFRMPLQWNGNDLKTKAATNDFNEYEQSLINDMDAR